MCLVSTRRFHHPHHNILSSSWFTELSAHLQHCRRPTLQPAANHQGKPTRVTTPVANRATEEGQHIAQGKHNVEVGTRSPRVNRTDTVDQTSPIQSPFHFFKSAASGQLTSGKSSAGRVLLAKFLHDDEEDECKCTLESFRLMGYGQSQDCPEAAKSTSALH